MTAQRVTDVTKMILDEASKKTGKPKTQIVEHLVLKYKKEIMKGI